MNSPVLFLYIAIAIWIGMVIFALTNHKDAIDDLSNRVQMLEELK